jgi:hypothetical protein
MNRAVRWGSAWSKTPGTRVPALVEISLLTIGIDFTSRSHGSGSNLRWPSQIEAHGRLFQPLKLLRSSPRLRPQLEGEREERPRVSG